MARCPRLMKEMADGTVRRKVDILSNGDIICSSGIHESTFYYWIGDSNSHYSTR